MKKLLLLLIFVNTIIASKTTLLLNEKAKKIFPDTKSIEQALKKNLNPLVEALKKTIGNGDLFLEINCNSACSFFLFSKKDCLAFQTTWTPHSTPLVIKLLTILPQYRLHGIGSTCIQCFDNPFMGELLGYKTISLECMKNAQPFYERLGFKRNEKKSDALFSEYSKKL